MPAATASTKMPTWAMSSPTCSAAAAPGRKASGRRPAARLLHARAGSPLHPAGGFHDRRQGRQTRSPCPTATTWR
jgi:hypothetical protein